MLQDEDGTRSPLGQGLVLEEFHRPVLVGRGTVWGVGQEQIHRPRQFPQASRCGFGSGPGHHRLAWQIRRSTLYRREVLADGGQRAGVGIKKGHLFRAPAQGLQAKGTRPREEIHHRPSLNVPQAREK